MLALFPLDDHEAVRTCTACTACAACRAKAALLAPPPRTSRAARPAAPAPPAPPAVPASRCLRCLQRRHPCRASCAIGRNRSSFGASAISSLSRRSLLRRLRSPLRVPPLCAPMLAPGTVGSCLSLEYPHRGLPPRCQHWQRLRHRPHRRPYWCRVPSHHAVLPARRNKSAAERRGTGATPAFPAAPPAAPPAPPAVPPTPA